MPYVDPNTIHDPAPSGVPPAAWGTVINDNLEYLVEMPYCSVYRTTTQSVPNATSTRLIPNAVRWDETGMHVPATNSTRITIIESGIYMINATAHYAGDADGYRQLQVHYTEFAFSEFARNIFTVTSSDPASLVLCGSMTRELTTGNWCEITTYHTAGAALNVTLLEFTVRKMARIP